MEIYLLSVAKYCIINVMCCALHMQVTRKVSALSNEQDDNGILVGNWSGDYSGGAPPTSWTGSGDIMKQFNATKEPVSFGQCWVFSGIQTTCEHFLPFPSLSSQCN